MRRAACAAWLLFCLAFLLNGNAWAGVLRDWTDQADVVCVARVTSIAEVRDGTFPVPYQAPLKTFLAVLQVQVLLKGELPTRELPLEVYRLDEEALRKQYPNGYGFSGWTPFYQLEAKQSYLIFAKKQVGKERYDLVSLGQGNQSAMEVGAVSKEITTQSSSLVNILFQLLAVVSQPAHDVPPRAIRMLGDFGDVLWDGDGKTYYAAEYLEHIRQAPDYQQLASLVKTRVIPAVLKLTKAQNAEVRDAALAAAANLQIAEVIPQLVSLIENAKSVSTTTIDALSSYKSYTAVPLLVPLLKNNNVQVRRATMQSLKYTQDPRSVPFLIEALEDKDQDVRYQATHALYNITEKMPPTTVAEFPAEERKYLDFWKAWAATHQDKLDKLRAQLDAKPAAN